MSGHCVRCGQPLPPEQKQSSTRENNGSLCESCRDITLDGSSLGRAEVDTRTAQQSSHSRRQIAQFALVRILGYGSFGEVWLADDSRLGREVALKLPNPNRPGASTLLYEAKTAASLRHPNIVAVYEVGEESGQVFIASEFIDGATLRDSISGGRPSTDRMIEILIPVTDALHFAHEHRVVHRDVKPANILLDRLGKPYVTDFGLAKKLSDEETISSRGQVIGTARYMSPEQAYGKTEDTDARSDIYSIGVMMFEMLTGESPFRGNVRAILQQKLHEDPPSPRLLEPTIPRDLETVCLKCLEREPAKRFATAKQLNDELKRFADGEPILSRPIGKIERGWRWCKRRPAISSLALALFLSLTAGLLGVSYYWHQSVLNAADAKQKLYRSWMNLAASRASSGDPEGVRELLKQVSDDPELAQMRGFAFNHFANIVQQLKRVGNLGNAVADVAVTYDGNTAAATGGGREIVVWDTGSDQVLRLIRAEQDGFTCLDFSSKTNKLVSGSVDGYLRFYEPLAGEKTIRQTQHGPPIRIVRFAPDGRYVIASGKTGAVRMWDADNGELVAEIPTGKGETRAIRFSPDSSRLYVMRDDGRVRQWAVAEVVETGLARVPTPKAEFNTGPSPVAMSVSDSGDQLVIAFYNGTLMVRDLRSGDGVVNDKVYQTSWGLVQAIEHLPETNVVAFTTSIGKVHLLDTADGHEIRSISTHAAIGRLARSGNGKWLLLGSGDGNVSKLNLQRLATPNVVWGKAPTRSVALLSADRMLAAYDNGDLLRWDLATGRQIELGWAQPKPTTLLAVDAAGRRVATAGNRSGVEIRESSSLDVVADLPADKAGVSAMQFSRSGNLFAVAVRKGPVRVYRSSDWTRPLLEMPANESVVTSIALSPDDRLVAVARNGRSIQVLDAADGSEVVMIELEQAEPTAVIFCQDDRTLAIGTGDGAIVFYDLPSRTVRTTSKGHTGRISALTIIPDSRLIVSAGRDKNLNIWSLDSGELVTRLRAHLRQVFTIAASADGKVLVSGALEGDTRIWIGSAPN